MSRLANLPGGTQVATTTAWGNADPLDVVLERIDANCSVEVIELAIGARPVDDPEAVMTRWAGKYRFIGHHTMPLGVGSNVRPQLGAQDAVAQVCRYFGLSLYTAHPPNRKHATTREFYDWARAYRDRLGADGIGFAVETMYVPRAADEITSTGGYHLATPAEVYDFCEWARADGWEQPLLVDASHLHIGFTNGDWSEEQIAEILRSEVCAELHVSENDGRIDAHRPLTATHRVAGWVDGLVAPLVVDEGRRRQSRGVRPAGREVM